MTFSERLKLLGKGLLSGVKNAYSGYANLVGSAGNTLTSIQAQKQSDLVRNLSNKFNPTSKVNKFGLDYASRLAELAQETANKAYEQRLQYGREGSFDQGFKSGIKTVGSGVKDTTKAVAYTAGLANPKFLLNPANIALVTGLSALSSKQSGKPFEYSLGESFSNMPYYAGFAKLTDPIFGKIVDKSSKLLPVAQNVSERITSSLANAGQGFAMDIANKRPITAGSTALDLATGALFGRNIFSSPNAKGFTVGKTTMDEIIEAEDMLKNPLKYIGDIEGTPKARVLYTKQAKEEVIKKARESLDRLAGKYLPNEIFDKTIDRPQAIIKALVDLNGQNKLGNFNVGFVEGEKKGVQQIGDILQNRKIEVNNTPVTITDKSKILSSEFGKKPEFFDLLQKKGWSADKIYSVSKVVDDAVETGKIRNPEGFTMYMLRKLYPKDEVKGSSVPEMLLEPKLSQTEIKKMDKVAEELKASVVPEIKVTKEALNKPPEIDDYNKGLIGRNAPELPEASKIKTPEIVSKVFKKGKDYFDGRFDSINERLTKAGLTPQQFKEAIENPQQTISKNVKALADEYQEVLDQSLKMSGAEATKREYYMPHIWEEDRVLQQVLPDTFIDRMNLKFGNLLPRLKEAKGFIDDPIQAGKDYVERALSYKYQAQIDAQRRGIPVEVVVKEQDIADKLGKAIQSGNTNNLDIIKEFKELEQLKGNKIVTKKVDAKINYFEMLTMDGWRNLKKLGIYDEAFAPIQRYKAYANSIYKAQIEPLVAKGDYTSAVRKVVELSGENINADRLALFLGSKQQDVELTSSVLLKATEKAIKGKAIANLQKHLAKYQFETGAVSDYVNAMAKIVLGSEVTAKDLLSQTLGFINKTYASGALGLNVRSGMNNLFEGKRILAATDLDSFGKGYKNAFTDPDKILDKYGIQSKTIEDMIKQNYGNTKGLRLLSNIQDSTLIMFQKSEELKDRAFLYSFEVAGRKAGKEGIELTKYVLDNFEKYANKFGGLGTIGMFNNKWVRTMLQFSQYGFKELQTIGDKVHSAIKDKDYKSISYLGKLAGANAIIHTITGALYGARFEEIWGSLPVQVSQDGLTMSFGPLPSLFEEIYLTASNAKEAVADSEETGEPVDWSRIWTNKLKKNLALLAPAGNQLINKTGATVSDMLQGYNASASDRVRFLSPETAYDKAIGLLFGPYSTKQSREYFDKERIPLGEAQSETFKDVNEVNPESAKEFYKGIMEGRDQKRLEKTSGEVTVEQILKGKKTIQSESQAQEIQKREASVKTLVAQGIDDPYEIGKILDSQAKAQGFESSDISTSEIKSYITLSKSPSNLSVLDILQKNSELSDKRDLINKVLISKDGGFTKLNESQKMEYLTSKGVSTQDVKDFMGWKLSNAPVVDRADYIIGNKEVNFAELYKNDILTAEVAKELERKGYIPSADKLMDQMKLTDPYYIKQYQKDLAVKKAKVKAGTVKDMLKAGYQARKDARKMLTKSTKKVRRTIKTYRIDATPITLDKPKSYPKFVELKL